jgi:hypothetical protein
VLDKIEANGFDAMARRPSVGALDLPLLGWRALRMRKTHCSVPAAGADGALR